MTKELIALPHAELQRWGRLEGQDVWVEREDGYWTPWHLANAEIELQAAQIAELRRVIEWALGEGDDFPDWPDTVTITGNPKYWWRKELRKRYDAIKPACTPATSPSRDEDPSRV